MDEQERKSLEKARRNERALYIIAAIFLVPVLVGLFVWAMETALGGPPATLPVSWG